MRKATAAGLSVASVPGATGPFIAGFPSIAVALFLTGVFDPLFVVALRDEKRSAR